MPDQTLSVAPAQLTWHIGTDDALYAVENQSGCTFKLDEIGDDGGDGGTTPPAGVPEAPTDGQLYGRENSAWAVVPPTPPSSGVQKTGDTMTGALAVKGDQFAYDTALAPPPAFLVEPSSGTGGVGIALGKYADSICFVKANGTGANIRTLAGTFMTFADSTGADTIQINVSAGFVKLINNVGAGGSFNLLCDANGDLIISSSGGPNVGKSVNLTYGKWT